jgi:predicted membrane channel-forming protein YqfA (hemolysin III family)
MKKTIGILSWAIAVVGIIIINLTTLSIIDNYILFYIGIGTLVLGAFGAFFAGKEAKQAVLKLFDLI